MATYLRVDIGESDIDLNDRVNYRLGEGWRPRVARRRDSGLGGWLYEDVDEEIPVQIFSRTSLDDCLDARDALVAAMDQVYRFKAGDDVYPVNLKYKIDGSSLTDPFEAEVLEGGSGEDLLQLQPAFNQMIRAWEIHVTLSLRRRGDWLRGVESPDGASGDQPSILTVSFAASRALYSPVKLSVFNIKYENQNGLYIPKGHWFVASATDKLLLIEAESRSTSDPTGSTAAEITDASASGGKYLEFDDGEEAFWNLDVDDINGDLLGIFALCNQTEGGDSWQITTEIYREATNSINLNRVVTIVDESPSYEPVRLGMLGRVDDGFTLRIQADRISGTGKFQIDYLAIIALGAPGERVIGFPSVSGVLPYGLDGEPDDMVERIMVIDDRRLVRLRPQFYLEDVVTGDIVTYLSYAGGDIHLASIGDKLLWLQMAGGDDTWLWTDDVGRSRTVVAVRKPVYLAPR